MTVVNPHRNMHRTIESTEAERRVARALHRQEGRGEYELLPDAGRAALILRAREIIHAIYFADRPHHRAKVTPDARAEIVRARRAGEKLEAVAARHGISISAVSKIVTRFGGAIQDAHR